MATSKSWFQIELDTTPPKLELYFPSKTTMDSIETITINSNEPLLVNHEIMIEDSKGQKHFYTFSLENDKKSFVGIIPFNDFSKGIATIHVRLSDEVGNLSSIYKGSFEVLNPLLSNLRLTIEDEASDLKLKTSTRIIILNERINNMTIDQIKRNMTLVINERKLILKEGDTNE